MWQFHPRGRTEGDKWTRSVRVRVHGRDARLSFCAAPHVEMVSLLRSTHFLFVADDLHPILAETAVGQGSSGDTLFGPFEQRVRQEFVNAKILTLQKFYLRMPLRERS